MIRIGDFSKLSLVSVKTLRYYDELGLLKPVQTDPFTGYRMYEYHQLLRLNRILALKDLGFSLEEIGRLLSENLSAEQLRGMLKLRRAEARQKVREDAERLDRVEARLRQIEQEDTVSKYDVVIKQIESLQVASLRGVVPTPPEQGTLWIELEEYLQTQRVRCVEPCLTLYHDDEYKERDWDLEVCQPIEGRVKETKRVKVWMLPAVPAMACVLHHGPLTQIGEAYDAIFKWMEANGYRICGPGREISLQIPTNPERGAVLANQSDPDSIMEVQFPVEKVK
jgi:DNA-binding transcriptional MerR regulator